MDSQLKKGILDMCILHVLKGGESYGYKIISDLSSIIPISESTLYPILKRLETSGCLQTTTRMFNGRIRRYYSITNQGVEKLQEGEKDFEELNRIYLHLFGGKKK